MATPRVRGILPCKTCKAATMWCKSKQAPPPEGIAVRRAGGYCTSCYGKRRYRDGENSQTYNEDHLEDLLFMANAGEHPANIARRLGCNENTMYRTLQRHGLNALAIEIRARDKKYAPEREKALHG